MSFEPTINSEVIYEGKILDLRLHTIKLAGGKTSQREIVEHNDSVLIVPIDDHGRIILVRQYRKAANKHLLEVPAGGIEDGEEPYAAAERELQEEIGFKSDNLIHIGGFWMAPGFCTEYMHAYIATDLKESSLPPDEDENIEVVYLDIERIEDVIKSGEVEDSKSISALMMVLNFHIRSL